MPKLKRALGFLEILIYGVGIILGAGIYALIGEGAGIAGNGIWLSFLIAALAASFTGLSYAELSSVYPSAGAEVTYIQKIFKNRLFSFLQGILIILSESIGAAAVSLAFSSYLIEFFSLPSFLLIPASISLILFLSFVSFLGIKESARLNALFTAIEILGLLIVIFLGLPRIGNFRPFERMEMPSILAAAGLLFFAYLGFEEIANLSEEAKKAKKIIPRALIFSIAITTMLYILTSIAALSLCSAEELSASKAPLALAVSKALGPSAFSILASIALFSTSNTVLGLLVVCSRALYGMGKLKLLPKKFSEVHKKTKTPWFSVLVTMILSLLFTLRGDLGKVAMFTSASSIMVFCVVNLSAIMLRLKGIRPGFKLPFNIGKISIIPILGLIVNVAMLFYFDLEVYMYILLSVLGGFILYQILERIR